MSPALRTWVSLGWRMVVALAVLAVVSVAIALTAILVSGLVIWLGLVVIAFAIDYVWIVLPFLDGWLVLVGWLDATTVPLILVSGLLSLPIVYLRPVREEIREFRSELGQSGTLARDRHPEVANAARRLAQQAGIPEPAVYIANRSRPESYALGGRSDGTIVLTRGLIRQLSDRERQAVLAHEISHLTNGDSRILNLSLVPLLLAEQVGNDERPSLSPGAFMLPFLYPARLVAWAALLGLTTIQAGCCRLGVSVLSRGREFAADRGAARLTGEPAALASALRTLDDERGAPTEDKRHWEQSASVLDILPREESAWPFGLFRTHPRTATRLARLEQMDVGTTARE